MKSETAEFIKKAKARGSVLGLSNMKHLMGVLGNVQERLPIIHIAGTNGKGSVGAYLASIFKEAGLSVGRYTSPAVFSPLEVFTVNGQQMEEEDYARLAEEIRLVCAQNAFSDAELPTIFELETAMAFLWFAEKKPDVILMECGMGGSEDATNVFEKPLASVITSISLDHTKFLGDTTEKIATVKGGIIKQDCPVFSAPQEPGAEAVLRAIAEEKDSPITFVDGSQISLQSEEPGRLFFTYKTDEIQYGLETKMSGHYQTINAALAMEVAGKILPRLTDLSSKELPDMISEGIYSANWPGRFEVIHRNPYFILDGAHNPGAAWELEKTIRNCFGDDPKLVFLMGVLGDKDHRKMLEILLPYAASVITITPDNPRALDGRILAEEARETLAEINSAKRTQEKINEENPDGKKEGVLGKALEEVAVVSCGNDLTSAVRLALSQAKAPELPILVCGSLSFLGRIREIAGLQFGDSVL